MAYSDIWSQIRYLAPYNYILDSNIVEFDIEKANINVLLYYGAINKTTYDQLNALPKMRREITVGRMMRREPNIHSILKQGIQEARRELFDRLNLDTTNVLSIKNDAVFVIFTGPVDVDDIQINELIKFKVKGHFRSFYYLSDKEIYYTYNPITYTEGMDIKGIGDYGLEQCHGFIRTLSDIFYVCLNNGIKDAYNMATKFYEDYMTRKFPIDFYRRFDSNAKFDMLPVSKYAGFSADFLDQSAINIIDPSYNLDLIRQLISYYTDALLKQ